ncbi:MAG: 50S ribosomal protein L10 [Parcubacteria group bacterium ADurb.Bin247]|jgi:large subunit ribosomal protein L10|nr:MAG: 50S ribosomal protein L10 [Parcubacteria group bacterium ADurb.Bin247]HQB84924.1 50S ribosomal protein L10 [Candidatus Pacearchaeota archaeon]
MPLTKEKKQEIVKDLDEKIKKQKAMIFVNFKGLKMDEISKLRSELRKSDAGFTVFKKTLMNIAFKNNQIDVDAKELKEEVGVVFGFSDPISPAKIAYNFSKDNPNLKIVSGFMDGSVISEEQVLELAKLPSREELLGKLVGTIQAPISGFVAVLEGNIKGLIYTLKQVKS